MDLDEQENMKSKEQVIKEVLEFWKNKRWFWYIPVFGPAQYISAFKKFLQEKKLYMKAKGHQSIDATQYLVSGSVAMQANYAFLHKEMPSIFGKRTLYGFLLIPLIILELIIPYAVLLDEHDWKVLAKKYEVK